MAVELLGELHLTRDRRIVEDACRRLLAQLGDRVSALDGFLRYRRLRKYES